MTFTEIAQGYWRASLRSFVLSLAKRNLTPERRRELIEKWVQRYDVAMADATWFDAATTCLHRRARGEP